MTGIVYGSSVLPSDGPGERLVLTVPCGVAGPRPDIDRLRRDLRAASERGRDTVRQALRAARDAAAPDGADVARLGQRIATAEAEVERQKEVRADAKVRVRAALTAGADPTADEGVYDAADDAIRRGGKRLALLRGELAAAEQQLAADRGRESRSAREAAIARLVPPLRAEVARLVDEISVCVMSRLPALLEARAALEACREAGASYAEPAGG
jgi:hypothetical protein